MVFYNSHGLFQQENISTGDVTDRSAIQRASSFSGHFEDKKRECGAGLHFRFGDKQNPTRTLTYPNLINKQEVVQ